MEEKLSDTMVKIQQAALEEFSDKGFLGASLRQIVKNAGVTTGAFYGYFSSKEALFASIVEPHATALMGRFMEAQIGFAELPEEEQPRHMGEASGDYVNWMVVISVNTGSRSSCCFAERRGLLMSTLSIIWWRSK